MEKNYFSKQYAQYIFSKSLIKAIGAPIDSDFDYKKRQGLERMTTYPKEMFYVNGMPVNCREFINNKCQQAGDCGLENPKTGEIYDSLS